MNALALAMPRPEAPAAVRANDPDADAVRRAATGDVRAFEDLYRRHARRVHGAIWRLVGGVDARAEELTQEAFVRAWQKLEGFRFESLFSTWLHRLAVNTALMDMRARKPGEDREDPLGDDDALPEHAPRVRHDLQIDLEAAVAKLPPRARAVLVLHDVEGWKHEEIGRELGMAVGSSKAQLHRARGLLRRALGEDHE
jgi:RNA polymerase sigma-70 factor (ECF subfamily)